MTNQQNKKSPQEMQDEIFKKMSAEEKIRLVSGMRRLAQKLNPRYLADYGAARATGKNSENSQST